MFPQLGAPLGFFMSTTIFLALSGWLDGASFAAYGWRIPFLASAVLVLVGLWVRLTIAETPVFAAAAQRRERVRIPMLEVLRTHPATVAAGTMMSLATFVIFYLMTVFSLSWGTSALGFSREAFLRIQLVGVLCFAVTIPISARIAEGGRRRMLIWASAAIALFGLAMGPIFAAGTAGAIATLALGLGLMGLTYGPLGTVLSELFPTDVRYTGSSLTFNLAGIVGASLAPYIATWLASRYGLSSVGYYLTGSALISIVGLVLTRETRDCDIRQ
jgi:MFS family permease